MRYGCPSYTLACYLQSVSCCFPWARWSWDRIPTIAWCHTLKKLIVVLDYFGCAATIGGGLGGLVWSRLYAVGHFASMERHDWHLCAGITLAVGMTLDLQSRRTSGCLEAHVRRTRESMSLDVPITKGRAERAHVS